MTAFELYQKLMKVDPDSEVLFELAPEPDEYGERSSLAAYWENVPVEAMVKDGKVIINTKDL
jgi:hypothetical protein